METTDPFEARFDAILPTLATKADVAELRAELSGQISEVRIGVANFNTTVERLRSEMHAAFASMMKWLFAALLTMFFGFAGLMLTLFKTLPVTIVAPAPALSAPAATAAAPATAPASAPATAPAPQR